MHILQVEVDGIDLAPYLPPFTLCPVELMLSRTLT